MHGSSNFVNFLFGINLSDDGDDPTEFYTIFFTEIGDLHGLNSEFSFSLE